MDVEVESDIPMAAGLGSSAAATVAGLRLFERVTKPAADSVLLGVATMLEGHADNAAPALFGGLNSVLQVEQGDPVTMRWTWPEDVQLVVATPAVGLATAKARAALADTSRSRRNLQSSARAGAGARAAARGNDGIQRGCARPVASTRAGVARATLKEVLAIDDPDVRVVDGAPP